MKKMLIVFFCFVCVFLYAEENKTAAIGITAGGSNLAVSLEVMASEHLSFVLALGLLGWDTQLMYHFSSALTGVSTGVLFLKRGTFYSGINAVCGVVAYRPVAWLRFQLGPGYITSSKKDDIYWGDFLDFLPDRVIIYYSIGFLHSF